jgi:hypothetical protein
LELYLATRDPQAPLGEILRQYNLHLDDLREIERTIEEAALIALKVKGRHRVQALVLYGRLPQDVSPERVQQLEQELTEKTSALAELSVAFTLLEKKDRAESLARRQAKPSPRRPAKRFSSWSPSPKGKACPNSKPASYWT